MPEETIDQKTAQNNTETVDGQEKKDDATDTSQSLVDDETSKESLIDEKKAEKKEQVENAPEEYDDFNLPEGFEIIDEQSLTEFKGLAKTFNLTQEKAQQMLDLAIKNIQSNQERAVKTWEDIGKEWLDDVKKDPELGGRKFEETIKRADRALHKFDPKGELMEMLKIYKFNTNPALIRFLNKIDMATSEHQLVEGKPAIIPKSAADIMYPNQGKPRQ